MVSIPPINRNQKAKVFHRKTHVCFTKTWADHLTGLEFGQQFVCGMMDWFMFQNKKYNLSKIWVKMLDFKRDMSE